MNWACLCQRKSDFLGEFVLVFLWERMHLVVSFFYYILDCDSIYDDMWEVEVVCFF